MGKPEDWGRLETYEEEEVPKPKEKGVLKKLWESTIFPDKIKKHKEQKRMEERIKHEAKLEAKEEAKGLLKEKYKQEEIDRLTGKKSDKLKKLGDAFSMKGTGMSSEKIADAFSLGSRTDTPKKSKPTKKKSKKKKKKSNVKKEKSAFDMEDKIKRMLG